MSRGVLRTCVSHLALLLAFRARVFGATIYVDAQSLTPIPPYASWATAAAAIQDALDLARPGDTVLVTNGAYATGGRVISGSQTSRIAVTNEVLVSSVNGPSVTAILGQQLPGTTNGFGAVRCAYLADGAVLSGFTVSRGATDTGFGDVTQQGGGGIWCASTNAVVTNCVIRSNSAFTYGGGAFGGTLINCVLSGNSVTGMNGGGGAVAFGNLSNCILSFNSAVPYGPPNTPACGGAAYGSTLNNCTLINNNTDWDGGGACGSVLNNCNITSNRASFSGGGVFGGTLNACTLSNNVAIGYYGTGGGASGGATLTYCTLTSNSAVAGGAASSGTLSNCTLRGNFAAVGGGTFSSSLSFCLVTSNSASGPPGTSSYGIGNGTGGGVLNSTANNSIIVGNSALAGGGEAFATLVNCAVIENTALQGGGAFYGSLTNCTITGNQASDAGGGAFSSTLNNSVVYYNASLSGANYDLNSSLSYCCTTPLPTNGFGSIAGPPLFLDDAHGNLRLQAGSPCINSGNNAYVTTSADLDGNPRIVKSTVDMGAYEYQGTGSVISHAWLQQYGLPTDGSADFTDPDNDGMDNWQEWVCGTDPWDAQSVLRVLRLSMTETNLVVTWQSVAGKTYFIEGSSNLGQPFVVLVPNIAAQTSATSFSFSPVSGFGPIFLRVGVRKPD